MLLLTRKGYENELLESSGAPGAMVRTEPNVIRPERREHISTAIEIHFTICLREEGGGCFVVGRGPGGLCSLACRFFFFDMARVSVDQLVDLVLSVRLLVPGSRIEPGLMPEASPLCRRRRRHARV